MLFRQEAQEWLKGLESRFYNEQPKTCNPICQPERRLRGELIQIGKKEPPKSRAIAILSQIREGHHIVNRGKKGGGKKPKNKKKRNPKKTNPRPNKMWNQLPFGGTQEMKIKDKRQDCFSREIFRTWSSKRNWKSTNTDFFLCMPCAIAAQKSWEWRTKEKLCYMKMP